MLISIRFILLAACVLVVLVFAVLFYLFIFCFIGVSTSLVKNNLYLSIVIFLFIKCCSNEKFEFRQIGRKDHIYFKLREIYGFLWA